MQKTKGLLAAQVTLNGGRAEKLRSITANLPDTVEVFNETFVEGPNNQNCLVFNIAYGPVWGGWASDIKSHFSRTAIKVGTKANVEVTRIKRVVVAKRDDHGNVTEVMSPARIEALRQSWRTNKG